MAGEPQLEKGQSGEWIQYLQQMLQQAGYWGGAVDGEFGDDLEQAVIQFQSSNGLAADGIVGPMTWATLTGQGNAPEGEGAPQGSEGTIQIDLAEFPAISELINYQTEEQFDEYLASIGLDASVFSDEDEPIA